MSIGPEPTWECGAASRVPGAGPLPNINGLLFVLRGYFGTSGCGNIRLEQIGKAVGGFLRARVVDIPRDLVQKPPAAS